MLDANKRCGICRANAIDPCTGPDPSYCPRTHYSERTTPMSSREEVSKVPIRENLGRRATDGVANKQACQPPVDTGGTGKQECSGSGQCSAFGEFAKQQEVTGATSGAIPAGEILEVSHAEIAAFVRANSVGEFSSVPTPKSADSYTQHPQQLAPRQKILHEAEKIVMHDRNAAYGTPENNFKQIAQLWSAYKGGYYSSADVALMLTLVKIARLAHNPSHHDSAVDGAGYFACLGDIQANLRTPSLGSGLEASQPKHYWGLG